MGNIKIVEALVKAGADRSAVCINHIAIEIGI
jgi:hypothetical protein